MPKNQSGIAHLLVLAAVAGLITFLLISQTAGFKDKLFSTLFPKPASQAQNQEELDKYGYIIELKDDPVVVKMNKSGKKAPQEAASFQAELKTKRDEAKKDVEKKLESKKGKRSGKVIAEFENTFNGFALDIDKDQAEEIKKSPFVKNVYPNLEVKATLNESVPLIGADKVWQQVKDSQGRAVTGQGVKIAVLDTGVDYTHPDLGQTPTIDRTFEKISTSSIPGGYVSSDQVFSMDNSRLAYPSISDKSIHVYSFQTKTTQIINTPINFIVRLVLKDNLLAYFGMDNINLDIQGIFLYDFNTQNSKQISDTHSLGSSLFISNGKVIYSKYQNNLSNIYIYDIASGLEKAIASPQDINYMPLVSGNLVVYSQHTSPSGYDKTFLYDMVSGQTREIFNPEKGPILDFRGNKILYVDGTITNYENRYSTKILYDINTGETLTLNFSPTTSGLDSSDLTSKSNFNYILSYSYISKASIQDNIVFYTKDVAGNRIVAYDLGLKRYVQINLLKPSGTIAALGNKICFASPDLQIYCHDYDASYSYRPPPANIFNNKIIGGFNFINNTGDPLDDHGHGTHVSATAAGNSLKGVSPGASIVAYKVLNTYGSGSFANVISAIDKAAQTKIDTDSTNDIDVISMSLGAYCSSYSIYCGPDDPQSKAVDNAADAGVVVVIAAGNSGPNASTINSPGTARKAITVGAVDKTKKIADFSSRGPIKWNLETINKPDIVAPGVSICAAEWDGWHSGSRCLDDKHISISGTSMATPHVAGLVALIKQVYPSWTPQQIKDAIKNNADNLGYDINTQGAGLVNAFKIFLKRVFVTNTAYNGKLIEAGSNVGLGTATNGLDGADKICQSLANSKSLGGIWKAWLSNSTTSASSRLTHYSGIYVRLDGQKVANDWTDLTDGTLQNPINVNESNTGGIVDDVWTYTKPDGNASTDTIRHCNNWTSSGTGYYGRLGKTSSTDSNWTLAPTTQQDTCNKLKRLYCIEQ